MTAAHDLALAGIGLALVALTAWLAERLVHRRGRQAAGRLDEGQRDWWRAARACTSEALSFALRLRAYGGAALSCADALSNLGPRALAALEWAGPPPQPAQLRGDRGRPGPKELWRRFDDAYQRARLLARPADDCRSLGEAALTLAAWVEEHNPPIGPSAPAEKSWRYAGPQAGMVHALAAPCLAELTARHLLELADRGLHIHISAVAGQVEKDGSVAQRTMLSLAFALAGDQAPELALSELLELSDTDLCHALEAIALGRRLARVFPAQRPNMLWVNAAMADAGAGHDRDGPAR